MNHGRQGAHTTPPSTQHPPIWQADRAIGEFFFACGISFNAVEHPTFKRMRSALVAAGPAYVLPNRQKFGGVILDDAHGRARAGIHLDLETAAQSGSGATLVTDGLTHVSRPFTNALVLIPTLGARSLGVIDSTAHLAAGGTKNGEYVATELGKIIDGLPDGSIALVVTDGASSMVAAQHIIQAGRKDVEVGSCHSHLVNLFFKDVANIPEVREVLTKAQMVATTFKNREKPLAVLKAQSVKHLGRELGTVVGADTRFGTHFITCHRLKRLQPALAAAIVELVMIELADVEASVSKAVAIIKDDVFWKNVGLLVDVLWPAMLLLRLLDSDVATMGIVVHAWRRLLTKVEMIAATVAWGDGSEQERTVGRGEVEEMLACLRRRMDGAFASIHYAGYLLNPALWDLSTTNDKMAMEGFKAYCKIVFAKDPDAGAKEQSALRQLVAFKQRAGGFNDPSLRAAAEQVSVVGSATPAGWWHENGYHALELKAVAVRALSQVASVGAAERGHKTHKFLQTKVRNRMASATASKLIAVHVGLRVAERLAAEDAEPADTGLTTALEAIEGWWAEEQEMMGEGLSDKDWGLDVGGQTVRKNAFFAWVEGWEAASMTTKSDTAKGQFRAKYLGMKLRLEGEEDGKEELRVVMDIKWDNTHRAKGWRVVAALCGDAEAGEGGEEGEDITMPINSALHAAIAAAADKNPNHTIRLPN